MIKSLRKRHLQIWTGIAVLLPAGIICAWFAVPEPVRGHLLQPASTVALPVLLQSVNRDDYDANLRTNSDRTTVQLEWVNKTELTSPSAIIYELSPSDTGQHIETADLIGRIDARGIYHFAIKYDSANQHPHFVRYDIIHHHVIDQINF